MLYRKTDSASLTDAVYSFVIYYDTESEYHCKRMLESETLPDIKHLRSHVFVDIEDSVVILSIRYIAFREFFDAFLNGAIIIKYHGYEVTPDINTLLLTDHRSSRLGKDYLYTQLKFKVRFEFQVH